MSRGTIVGSNAQLEGWTGGPVVVVSLVNKKAVYADITMQPRP